MEIYQKRYFKCDCQKPTEWEVEHLFKREGFFGPWVCKGCRHSWSGYVQDGAMEATKSGVTADVDHPVLLKLAVPIESVLFVARFTHVKKWGALDVDAARYLFEEHHCPTNVLQMIEHVAVSIDGRIEDDYHGLFKVMDVGPDPLPPDDPEDPQQTLKQYLSDLQEKRSGEWLPPKELS